jgi:hypothetical protein
MRFVAALLLLVAACSQSPGVSTATPGAPASAARAQASPASGTLAPQVPSVYAVIVKDFLFDGGANYTVSLVATDGHVAAGSTVPKRTVAGVQIGNLSTSKTTLYYLDGDADIRFLRPDGAKGTATHIVLGPHQAAAFAVSPDDRRIAVSVLDYTRYPVSTRLYVEDLSGGGNHVELFSSPTVLEWPAGWHNGSIVMAIGRNSPPQNGGEWFERGYGYHIADAQTGVRLQSVCEGGDSFTPESPAGTVCLLGQNAAVVSWDGVSRPLPKDGLCPKWGPVSPAGVIASRSITLPDGGCTSGASIFLIAADGTQDHSRPLAPQSQPEGWMDGTHLVVIADNPPNSSPRSVLDVASGVVSAIQAPGFFAAALPGGL